jgi:hypothetical protein
MYEISYVLEENTYLILKSSCSCYYHNSVYGAQLNRFHPKWETASSLQNVMF